MELFLSQDAFFLLAIPYKKNPLGLLSFLLPQLKNLLSTYFISAATILEVETRHTELRPISPDVRELDDEVEDLDKDLSQS